MPGTQWTQQGGREGVKVLPDVTEHQIGDLGDLVDELFDDLYAVVILNSDYTTFAEVEQACIVLFGYTADEARALSQRVHTTGQAVAAVLGRADAARAVSALRAGNVRARMTPA